MTTSTQHDWLRRVSDYHSGSVAETERAAVEAHVGTCTECQEALAMYHRFYRLLRSPLRLGAPSAAFGEDTVPTMGGEAQRTATPPSGPPYHGQPPKRTLMAGIAAGLAAALVVGGFLAALALRANGPAATTTPTPRQTSTTALLPTSTISATAGTTATATVTATPAPGAFVCANPAGSKMTYAYLRGDGNLYVVEGCTPPRQITTSSLYPWPLAWSPSNDYLAFSEYLPTGDDKVIVFDVLTGKQYDTGYSRYYGPSASVGDVVHLFIGWLDDVSFLGADVTIGAQPGTGAELPISITLEKVDLFNGKKIAVTKMAWAADMVLTADGRYLFYGGYRSTSEGGAYLHRVDLTAATDTKLVSLGMAGFGPCQGTPVCPWTGPWGVTADGTHVAYHNPGPSSTPSDTNNPKDTPIFYASVDGSNATKPFGTLLAQGITTPVFSPDGHYLAAYGSTYAPYPQQNDATMPQTALATLGGPYKIINGRFTAWRADSQAMVLETADGKYLLYSPASGTTRTLESGADVYLWGH